MARVPLQEHRLLDPAQRDILRETLAKAATSQISQRTFESIDKLKAVAYCSCGCASIEFESFKKGHGEIIADAVGKMSTGKQVGIIVWANPDGISYLEFYTMDSDEALLPLPGSVRSWGALSE